MAVKQIVAGATARDLAIRLVTTDTPALPINPSAARLQGRSDQMRGTVIDVAMTIGSGVDANLCSLAEFGNLVTVSLLGNRASALFTFEIKYTVNAKDDFSPRFQYEWVRRLV